jgi:copper chaperone
MALTSTCLNHHAGQKVPFLVEFDNCSLEASAAPRRGCCRRHLIGSVCSKAPEKSVGGPLDIQCRGDYPILLTAVSLLDRINATRRDSMERQTFSIPSISCGHCTASIENELKELEGVADVSSDILAKTVTVQWQPPMSRETIIDTLKEINYPAAE